MVASDAKQQRDIRAVVLDVLRRLTFGEAREREGEFFAVADVSECRSLFRHIARAQRVSNDAHFEELISQAFFNRASSAGQLKRERSAAYDRLYEVLIAPHCEDSDGGDFYCSDDISRANTFQYWIECKTSFAAVLPVEHSQVIVRLWAESLNATAFKSWLDVQSNYADANLGLDSHLFAVRTAMADGNLKVLMWVGLPELSSRAARRAIHSQNFSKKVGLKRSGLFAGEPHGFLWHVINENTPRMRPQSAHILCSALVWRDEFPAVALADRFAESRVPQRLGRKRAVDLFLGRDIAWNEAEESECDFAFGDSDDEDDEILLPSRVVRILLSGPPSE